MAGFVSGNADRAPLISVILPVCNAFPYLSEAIRSIQNQTLADFEILAIDDGSTDASAVHLLEAARHDPRISVIANPQKGLVEALNLGLDRARGQFIARMDADDISAPNRFEMQISYLKASPSIAVVGSAITVIDQAGLTTGFIDFPTEPSRIDAALEAMDCPMAHGSVMARRQVLTSVGGYRSTFRHAEDYEIWLRITERYRIANLSERLMCYRRHSHSVSRAHHYEQRLATHVALLCARERRSGRPDPMTGFKHISLADVLRLEVEENQRAMIVRSMLEDCRRQSAIARKPLPARVRAAMQNIARWL